MTGKMTEMMKKRHDAIVSEFSNLPDWEARYQHLIALGKAQPDLPDELRQEEALVRGCQSKVWLHVDLDENGLVVFKADSDAMIVKGLVFLLVQFYSKASAQEIIETSPEFIKEIGLAAHLSPSRSNGLLAMIKQIKIYALAMQHKALIK